jgi:hypothetical protein
LQISSETAENARNAANDRTAIRIRSCARHNGRLLMNRCHARSSHDMGSNLGPESSTRSKRAPTSNADANGTRCNYLSTNRPTTSGSVSPESGKIHTQTLGLSGTFRSGTVDSIFALVRDVDESFFWTQTRLQRGPAVVDDSETVL